MTELSRRNFLRFLAASLGSLGSIYLAGCLDQDKLLSKSFSADKITPTGFEPAPAALDASTQPGSTAADVEVPTASPSPAASYPDLAVARSGEPEKMVRAAVEALGGMKRFVKERQRARSRRSRLLASAPRTRPDCTSPQLPP